MLKAIPETRKQKEARFLKLSKKELVFLLCNSHEVTQQIKDFYDARAGQSVNNIACDVCGRHPNTIITTQFGRYCQEHVKYV